ncbi:MAG TPA: MFS transporter [Terriglobales bacterium]|nr:MFS transporter [Terriglobales bacterium]
MALFPGVTSDQRKTLVAAALGWALDAFDVMLYALVLAHVMRDLGMDKPTAGLLGTLTLLASGIGGVLFGFLADRIGRTKALMLSILTYSVCSFASGLSNSIFMLACFRFVLGLGMGGEWNTGATLVAETWPVHLRAKALSAVQSSWALGYAAAALVSGVLLTHYNWRVVFFVGIAPALVILWIRSSVPESPMWKQQQSAAKGDDPGIGIIFSRPYLKQTIALLLMNFFGMFAWWGLFTWLPPYFSLPVSEGGRGFGVMDTTRFLVTLNLFGMFPGYFLFGWVADRIGRRLSFILYTLGAAILVPFYAQARSEWAIMLLGILVAFFGTGFFSGSGIIASEIYPTHVRARALGFTYPGARALSSIAPFIIGYAGQKYGLSGAFYLCAGGFLMSSLVATQIPETKGKELD